MADLEKLEKALRALDEANPMKTRIVASEEEFSTAVEEMGAKGFRIAASSNAGLPEPKRRLTFLPASAFVGEPLPEGRVDDIDGPPRTRKPPRDLREIIAKLEAETAEASKSRDLTYPPDRGLPSQKRDPSEAQSAFTTLARHCGLLPSGSEPESHS